MKHYPYSRLPRTKNFLRSLFRLPQATLIVLVKGYRLLLSPALGSACRFEPTCSAYSLQALQQGGAVIGTYLTLGRLVRCHPWCAGGSDPVPTEKPRLFTQLIPSSTQKKSS